MTRPRRKAMLVVGWLLLVWNLTPVAPTMLVVQLDQTFEEVAKHSTFSVHDRPYRPVDDPSDSKFGVIWVSEPAVIIRYDDPVNGFTLPSTKFAGIPFMHNRVQSIETSPMLEARPFTETVEVLRGLQDQFKAKGWLPWAEDNSDWIDLSPDGKQKLNDRMLVAGFSRTITLVVPKKNLEMMLRIDCFKACNEKDNALFLIDVGVGHKSIFNWDGQ